MNVSGRALWLCLLSGTLISPLAVNADPSPDTPEHVLAAGELIIDEMYYMSEPRADGSYFTASVRPDDSVCTLTKTKSEYTEDGDEKDIIVTTYDVAQIDPELIAPDAAGGVQIFALDDKPVFHIETITGGAFEMSVASDLLNVSGEGSDVDELVEALKTMVTYCVTGS